MASESGAMEGSWHEAEVRRGLGWRFQKRRGKCQIRSSCRLFLGGGRCVTREWEDEERDCRSRLARV